MVPGYRVDPFTHKEEQSWRVDYFSWYEKARDWRLWAQEKFISDSEFREDILVLCSRQPEFFNFMFMVIEEPRSMEYFDPSSLTLDDALATLDASVYDIGLDDLTYRTIHPFIPFAYQIEAWQLLTKVILGPMRSFYHDILWDKARGIGMSYAFLAWAYWAWVFVPGIRGTILTEKWDKAERSNDLNSLFGKLDLFIDNTPEVLIPTGFKDKGERAAHRQRGSLLNPVTGAAIFTEPTTADSTRGGREAYVGVDEINFHEYLDETWATIGGTTKHRCGWSSANYRYGRQGERKFEQGRKFPRAATVKTLDWFENPHQGPEWERAERERFKAAGQEAQFDVEYLRNAAADSGQLVYISQAKMISWTDEWFMPNKPLKLSVDTGTEDYTAFVMWQTFLENGKKKIRWLDAIQVAKLPVYFWAHVMTGIKPVEGDKCWPLYKEGFFEGYVEHIMEWMRTVPPRNIMLYGDPAMLRRDVTHDSWVSYFEKLTRELRVREGMENIPIYCQLPAVEAINKRNNFHDRRVSLREALMFSEMSNTDGARELHQAWSNTRFQQVTERTTRPPGHIHDIYSHYVQASEFGMSWEMNNITPDDLLPVRAAKSERTRRKGLGRKAAVSRSQRMQRITRNESLVQIG